MIRNRGLVLALTPFLIVLAGACSSTVTDGSILDGDAGDTDSDTPITPDAGTRKDGGSMSDGSTSDGPFTMTDGAAADGSSSDGSTHADGSTSDASSSDASSSDASSSDASTTDAGPLVCGPGTVSGFSPTWWPPSAFHQTLCTPAQTTALSDCFVGIPDSMTCDAFNADTANAACIACAVTPSTATIAGPIVEDAVLISINTAGCIARTSGDVTATGCGAKRQAADQCEVFACSPSCPALDSQGADDYIQCLSDADTSTCMTYATAATCADAAIEADGSAPQCALTSPDFNENAAQYITLFCGAP